MRAQVVNVVSGFGLSWQASFGVITLLYFYSHYLFASGAAHIGAMYTAFLSVAVACGTPGLLAAIALGQVLPVLAQYSVLEAHIRQAGRQTGRQAGRQTGRQTGIHHCLSAVVCAGL